MQLLNQIVINRPGRGDAVIQLLQGDLTAIPKEHATDILIISAYPGSYIPVPKTLIAGLYNKGIDIAAMAKHKEIDLRDQLGCWLSAPLDKEKQEKFNFKKILCFEPSLQNSEQESVVGNIFRCINTFAFNEKNNVIAMPVLASGKQRVPIEKMLPAMLDAGIFWLENGLPLTCIKLVLLSDEQTKAALPIFVRAGQQNELKQRVRNGSMTGADALKQFEIKKSQQIPGEETMQIVASEIKEMAEKEKKKSQPAGETGLRSAETGETNKKEPQAPPLVYPGAGSIPPAPAAAVAEKERKQPEKEVNQPSVTQPATTITAPANTASTDYDCFVSYAHKHADVIDAFVKNLEQGNKKLHIFYDKSSIPAGGLWIKQISDAIQKSKKVLIFLSPDYSSSLVCWDEFQCAKLIEYNSKKQIIQTIYLYNDTAMPPIMGIYSWTDCREGDKEKLEKIATQLINELS